MARIIRTIEAVASSTGMEVDRDAGIIHGVKILGLVSDNNRKYMPEAVRKAKSLYEGIKVNIDHPAESGDVRSAEDRFGKLINVKYVEGEGLYGDLMFLKSHPMAERICEAAERNDMNDTFGLSHNAQGDGQEDDQGCFVVSSIVEVRHVDLVADPATTKSLREARTRMKEATDFENSQIKRENDQLLAMPTAKVLAYHVNNTGGYIKSKYTAAEMGGKQALIGDILRAKFPKKTVEEFFAWEDAKKKNRNRKPKPRYGDHLFGEARKLGESDMPDDEDEMMTEAEEKLTKLQIHSRKMKNDPQFRAAQEKMARDAEAETAAQIMAQKKREREGGGYQAEIFLNGRPYKDSRILKSKAEAEKFGKMYEKEESDVGQKYTYKVKKVDVYGYTVKESDGQEEEPIADEEMTEASGGILGPIMKEITSNVSKAKEAIKTAKAQGATARQKIKGSLGAKITAELNRVLYVASEALDTLAMQIHTMDTDPTWAGEGIMHDDEDEMMTEAEDMPMEDPSKEEEMTEANDMPVDDPSEEEMTEAGDSGKQEYAAKVKPLVQKADSLASEARQKLHDASMIVSNLSNHVSGKQLKKYLNSIGNLLSDSKQNCFDAEKFLSAAASGNWDIDESINDEDEMMPEADDMPVEDPSEEEMTEAISLADKYEARDFINQSSLALHKLMKMLKDIEAKEDSAKVKQAIKTTGSTTDKIIKELSSLYAQFQAASVIEESEGNSEDDMPMDEADDELAIEAEDYTEEEYSDDEDKMAMESKRRLQRFCKTNGVVLTEGLLKDLKPLTEAAQRRCILRIKLASKARKPRSSGSMMPMTESKVHTGDNVFNWLRS